MFSLLAALVLTSAQTSVEAPVPEPTPEETPPPVYSTKKPWVAGLSSGVIPGLGFVYLGETRRGLAYAGIETAELLGVAVVAGNAYDEELTDEQNERRAQRVLLPVLWLQNTHFLGVYDAWRTARLRTDPARWSVPTPGPSATQLLKAPLQGRQLLRPEVGIPLGIVAALGATYSFVVDPEDYETFWERRTVPLFSRDVDRWHAAAVGEAYWVGSFYMVGIGEEALFRGVVQTSFEEWLGPRWGWIAASVVFGAAHYLNAPGQPEGLISVAVTASIGSYLGWLYQRDGYDLTGPVFLHAWYDVVVGTTWFLSDPENQPFSASISIPF